MLKRVAFFMAGWMFLILGAAGLFLPILPGVLFLVIGLAFLSLEYTWARRLASRLLRHFPAADRKFQGMLAKLAKPSSA
jgi:uncharacterized membrane protein YbaN (DUF454 family)